jgi:asparagine synthase (glutamine-hydrolysing)
VCGICGFVEPAPGAAADALERTAREMAKELRHRGPDALGTFSDPGAGIALGHTRLSIVDVSPAGAQPMRSACGRFALAYNGELYNFRELRAELAAQGARFRGGSDTEVLLAAIERFGVEQALRRANGMFAFALWDARERELLLARDRIGKKPLYYALQRGRFLFGSELKALRAHPAFEAQVDPDAVGCLVQYSYVPAPHAIYRGVHKLPAGSLLRVRVERGAPALAPLERWWRLEDVAARGAREPFAGSPEEGVAALDALLGDAVERRMIADVPLGALLSGGLDSTAVVALMQARASGRVATFTIGFEEASHDESADAARVAAHLGTDHQMLVARPRDALELIPELPVLYDEPFADTSQIPTALVCRLARRHVTVALSGDGGDELLAGYDRYFRCLTRWRWLRGIPRGARAGAGRALAALAPVALEKVVRTLPAADLADLFVRMNARCADPRTLVPAARPLPSWLDERAGWPPLADPLALMMWLDAAQRLPESMLVKVDRASMAVGLEVRCPLLDHRVVELLAGMPTGWKVRGGERKWLLRRLLARYLPPGLAERPKRGFGVPLGAWLRGELREWAESLLDERRLREDGLLDAAGVRAVWRAHLAGRRNRPLLLWNLLVFLAWQRAGAR